MLSRASRENKSKRVSPFRRAWRCIHPAFPLHKSSHCSIKCCRSTQDNPTLANCIILLNYRPSFYFTSNPSSRKHILWASIIFWQSGSSSPLNTIHSSRGFFVSGQQQQIGFPVLIPNFFGFCDTGEWWIHTTWCEKDNDAKTQSLKRNHEQHDLPELLVRMPYFPWFSCKWYLVLSWFFLLALSEYFLR